MGGAGGAKPLRNPSSDARSSFSTASLSLSTTLPLQRARHGRAAHPESVEVSQSQLAAPSAETCCLLPLNWDNVSAAGGAGVLVVCAFKSCVGCPMSAIKGVLPQIVMADCLYPLCGMSAGQWPLHTSITWAFCQQRMS
eukprot:CAMPEP_0178381816 /NCGR_PEP_ID=MMETSP0689_2-20121128/6180_1 /TAXON_ID=160604 /ORGANISM="Amphidinium massartii, Strain CS-259" /LENGTH=138 /DNA_ID=CAMNT_0020002015 /DNA_START=132 /DNA_END=547 /DNA_ORIENTATION=+